MTAATRMQDVTVSVGDDFPEIRESVRRICADLPGSYWRGLEERQAYPTEFVHALTKAGFLGALIPEEYGGAGCRCGRPPRCSRRSTHRAAMPRPAMRRCRPTWYSPTSPNMRSACPGPIDRHCRSARDGSPSLPARRT